MPLIFHYYKLRATVIFFFILLINTAKGQLLNGCVYLQGDYVEIGIAPNGAFGTPNNAPAGYHPRPSPVLNSLYNPVTDTYSSRTTALGFVADYGKDGWTNGTPAYFGDYFMPGAVQEGFSIQVNGARSNAWSNNYQSNFSTGFTGLLTGNNVSVTVSPTESKTVWQGKMNTLMVRQTISLKNSKSYFTSNVVLKNTGTDTLFKIYYLRTVDPDNEVSITNNFVTSNKIAYQLPNSYNKTLVTATGTTYKNAYLGLGTKDCQAKCFIINGSLFSTADLESTYNGTSGYMYADSLQGDVGIGLVFKIGTLAPGDSTSFSYAYILNEADLDDAFTETEPGFQYNGTFYPSGSVIVRPSGSVLPIDIVNGDYYNWTWLPPSFLDTTAGTHVNDTVSANPITYTVTGIGNGVVASRCSNRNLSITISPYPVSPPPSVISPVIYCVNQPSTPLTASGLGLMRWYTNAVGGTGVTTAPTPSTATPGTSIWYVTQELNGVESRRIPVTVIINAPPVINISISSPIICFGDSTQLIASGTPANYSWSPAATLSKASGDTVKAFPSINTTYTVSAIDNGGCTSSKTAAIVVKPLPAIVAKSSAAAVCLGDAAQLTASGSAITYIWTADPSLNTVNGVTVTATPKSTATYFVTGTDINNCKNKTSVMVVVNPLPAPNLGPDKSICTNAVVSITPGNFTKYTWLDNSALPAYDVNAVGSYWVEVENIYGCKASDTINILSLFVLPKDFMPNDTTFCKGNILTINVPGYAAYLWNDGSVKSSNTLNKFGQFKLTVKDKNGCYGIDSIRLFDAHCIPFAIPNAFTPNQDGKNDVFRPFITQIVTGYKMTIFNRWGEQVFETDVPAKGWDGMYKGYLQSPGTYVYLIVFNDSDGVPVQLKGTLNLIK